MLPSLVSAVGLQFLQPTVHVAGSHAGETPALAERGELAR